MIFTKNTENWDSRANVLAFLDSQNGQYCTVLAVLAGLQTTPLNISHFIADYTVGTTIALLQTVLSLAVLTIHPFRRLSPLAPDSSLSTLLALVASSLANYSLHTRLSLRWADADGRGDTMPHRSSMRCDRLVTGESSVVYSQCIAASG
jgi:hypothetical protein